MVTSSVMYGSFLLALPPASCHVQVILEFEFLDERRLHDEHNLEIYQQMMAKTFNKRLRLRSFIKGQLVAYGSNDNSCVLKSLGKT